MPCENAAQSDDYFEFIGEYSGVVDYVKEEFNTECITVIDQRFAIAYVPKNGRTSIYGQNCPYNTIPRCFGLMDTQMLEDVGVAQVRRSTLELYGNSVLVGMIDTGIDYEHQAFRYEDGSSKIYSLWDQTIKGNPEDTFLGYGTEYTKEQIEEAVKESEKREAQLQEQILGWQKEQEVQRAELEQQNARIEKLHLELANAGQKEEFAGQNLKRIEKEIRNLREEEKEIGQKKRESLDVIAEKEAQIRQIESRIAGTKDHGRDHGRQLQKLQAQKEEKSAAQKTFFTRREELSGQIADLDKENFRLASMQEKLESQKEERISQIWDEYQVTPSEAAAFRNENGMDQKQTRKRIEEIKAAIRQMGNINVNAIEDYKEMSQRHGFLQNQHDDLIKAEKALEEIILELDEGMRKQFRENFARIQVEFDKAFRELFGGGKGTLELVDDEDILEAGIRIISQPPGKKLQNMMQLSGGEKALTAIALLFAIQHLKPSPFCLLDEIEAALDEANVSRYANYLHKLTKNTQFIIITHRRGTMAAADRLYGITMQEKGISALVSVNLIEEALDQ